MIFTLIHAVLIGGISVAGLYVYGFRLGVWVAASAIVAGFASAYLFAKEVPGETLMKVLLGLAVAANAAYIVHNGAQAIGIDAYNTKQVEKFERGMAEAGKATSRRIARELRLGAKDASTLEKAFSDGVALWAAILAFIELGMALIVFAMSSRRRRVEPVQAHSHRMTSERYAAALQNSRQTVADLDEQFPEVLPTGRLIEESKGKGQRR